MFLTILGFIICVIVAIVVTIYLFLFFLDSVGVYNLIGGVPNSTVKRIFGWCYIVCISAVWYWVYYMSPFEVVVK